MFQVRFQGEAARVRSSPPGCWPRPRSVRTGTRRRSRASARSGWAPGLLEAGLPTRMIKRILPCLKVPGILYCPEEATPEMLAALEEERDRMTQRIQFLARNRDAIASYLDVARTTGLPGQGGIS